MAKPVLRKSVRSDWFFLGQPLTILSTNVQESANTKKKTVTDMNTLLRYMEANGMKNELEHLFSNFFIFSARRKNGEGCEPATVSSLQPSIQRYLTYARTMSSKNPEKSVQRSQIPLFTSTAKEAWQTASCSSRHRQRGCPF